MRRPRDWFRQAQLDLAAARSAREHGHHEWACFAAQQAAEKAVKALHESMGTEAWSHSVVELLRAGGDLTAISSCVACTRTRARSWHGVPR
jgi:HEPN domain-containing protein